MDAKPRDSRAAQKGYRQRSPDLPRHWITLPWSVRTSALRHPLLRGLFPSHVGYFPRAREHRIERQDGIESTIFNYCVKGRGFCTLAGTTFPVETGDLMVVPAGEPHAYGTAPEAPWTVHWFHAMGAHVPLLLGHLGVSAQRPVIHLGRSPTLEALFIEVRQALEDDYSETQLVYAAQILGHLLGVMTRHGRLQARAASSTARRIQGTIDHMKRQLAEPLDVDALAAMAELSRSHFSALFSETTGYPPKEYLTRLRMHRAAQLMDTTDLTVKRIAREVGFADPLHFSRVFRRVNEQSPRAFRARLAPTSRT